VTVAVIDTGITVKKNLRHEALKDVSDGGTVLYDSAYDAATSKLMKDENFSDFIGHGTKVSSVVSGMSKKITGISNGARILPINIYENIQTTDSGKYEKYTGYASTSSVIRAYQYILDHSDELNIRVINLSFGGNPTSDDEILQEYIDKAYKQGILSVASSGNNGTADYNYPASADHVISVGATDKDSQKCEFSQYNNKVDLVASGENILVSKGGILKDRETGSNFMYKTTSYSLATGTSFSAPIVAGTAAMMFAENPDLSCEDAEKILKDTASDLGMSGKDDLFGYGEVNAYQAVNASLLNKKITKESELKGSQRPSGIKLSSVKVKKYFAVTWKKVSGISGYQIQYSEKKSFKNGKTITVRNKNSVSKKILKNPVKRTYYIRIRTYKTVSGKKVCSGWSKPVVVRPGKK
jgi:subtilisin family serine protease